MSKLTSSDLTSPWVVSTPTRATERRVCRQDEKGFGWNGIAVGDEVRHAVRKVSVSVCVRVRDVGRGGIRGERARTRHQRVVEASWRQVGWCETVCALTNCVVKEEEALSD